MVIKEIGKKSKPPTPHESWLHRQALQIAAQLPDDREDALQILAYAGELVRDYLFPVD